MKEIYLDNAATTRPDKDALSKACEVASELYYNPSAKYRGGLKVQSLLLEAREIVLSRSSEKRVVFTSGGTEADNTAIFGFIKRGNAVTTLSEHAAVYNSFEKLKNKGNDIRYAPLDKAGRVDTEKLLSLIDKNTSLVSVINVNNETGAINDINQIAKEAKKLNPDLIFHSDGVQAYGKLPIKLSNDVDLYSVSAHKIGAIKGVGALLYNKCLHVEPYIIGGGQEQGLRSGTENVLGILDFSYCAEKALQNIESNLANAKQNKLSFIENLDDRYLKLISDDDCSPFVVSVVANGLKGEVLQHMLEDEGIIVGTGSACSSKHPHSRVIKACGYSASELDGVLRISFGFNSTIEEAAYCAKTLSCATEKLYKVMKKR